MNKKVKLKISFCFLALAGLIFLLFLPAQAARKNHTWGTQFSEEDNSTKDQIFIGRDKPYNDLRMQVITPPQEKEQPTWHEPLIIEPHIDFDATDFFEKEDD